MTSKKINLAQSLFKQHGAVVKMNVLRENKLFSKDVAELISAGFIRKVKPGYYVWVSEENNMTDVELVAAVIPQGIICLESAAFYYDLSTINPTDISVAIPSGSTLPRLPDYPPIKLVTIQSKYFELGLAVEKRSYSNLRIYNKERTVCDFFKKRNQLGEDLALEVLKNYMTGKRQIQLLMDYAGQMRIKTILKPYVEALL